MVAEKLSLKKNESFNGTRKGILDPKKLSIEERNELIKKNPAYGQIICRCESVTAGEIIDAITRTLGAKSLDGIKRRTRAGMGRCQAGFCTPRQMDLLEKYAHLTPEEVTKSGGDSVLVFGKTK
ncbi:MAG TPA: FAD/NAD(P)-binding oxidoreductase, partial [Lachnospiraceae bacterium]|nr:FAD/NAD(P)-binding oxidoreductase [Lachnospiraceae bacterium]